MFNATVKKTLLLSLVILLIASSSPEQANAKDLSIAEAINMAGSQRMLTQHMLETYCLKGMQISPGKYDKQLKEGIARFSKQLDLLAPISNNQSYTEAIAAVRQQWESVKKSLMQTPKKENVIALRGEIEKLLQQSHAVVVTLEKAEDHQNGQLVNLSGRQRMLTQRISALYILRAWGIKDDNFSYDAELAVRDFEAAMKVLSNAKENTAMIQKKWGEVAALWRVYGLVNIVGDDSDPSLLSFKVKIVTESADNILITMNQITEMYAKL